MLLNLTKKYLLICFELEFLQFQYCLWNNLYLYIRIIYTHRYLYYQFKIVIYKLYCIRNEIVFAFHMNNPQLF